MDISLRVTAEERSGGLGPEAQAWVSAQLSEQGFMVLEGVFDAALIDTLRLAYLACHGRMTNDEMQAEVGGAGPSPIMKTGDRRFDVVLRMTAPFDDAAVYASPAILSVVSAALSDFHLTRFSVVVSHPGAELQGIHRDYGPLFGNDLLRLPSHAVSVAIPLVDLNELNGGTALWAGSHHWPIEAEVPPDDAIIPLLQRGDCVIYDYRTLHTGLPNRTAEPRPILFLIYARPWFFDESNHRRRNPVDMPVAELDRAPLSNQVLLTRARTASRR